MASPTTNSPGGPIPGSAFNPTPMPGGSSSPTGLQPFGPPGAPYDTGLHTESTDFGAGHIPKGAQGTTINVFGDPIHSQYMPGDQWKVPLSDPQSIPQIQQMLVQAGLLSAKQVRIGVWDNASASAYSTVLGFANAYGINATQALNTLINNPKVGKGASTAAQPIISYTNPADVATGFQNVSQNLTGQEQDPAAFAAQFHSQESAAQHQRGQNYTQAPSITGAATQYIQQHDPSQELAYGTASRMQQFFAMLPGVSG